MALAVMQMLDRAIDGLEWVVFQGLLHRYYRTQAKVFPPAYLEELKRSILTSKYLNENPLNRNFTGTYGFSVVFKPATVPQVRKVFPFFTRYLKKILNPQCNALYLNPLLLRERGRVAPHVDLSLRSYTQPDDPPTPLVVSLLYVDIPTTMRGGELLLYRGLKPVGRIRPRTNTIVHFRGDLRHEVSPVEYTGEDRTGIRLSLVCEQYQLEEKLLQRIPDYTVQTRSDFSAILDAELEQMVDAPVNPYPVTPFTGGRPLPTSDTASTGIRSEASEKFPSPRREGLGEGDQHQFP